MKPKKFISAMSAILIILLVLTSCGKSPDNKSKDAQSVETGNESSLSTTEEKTVTLTELTSTGEIPYEYFIDAYIYGDNINYIKTELFPFCYNSKYGFADAEGNIVISEKYDKANYFSEDKAFVKVDSTWKVIDVKGNELYSVPSGYDCSNSFFQNGKAIIINMIEVENAYRKYDFSVLVIDENMQSHEFKKEGGIRLEAKTINTLEFSGILTCHLMSYPDSSSDTGYRYEYVYILYDLTGSEIWTVTVPDKNDISYEYFDALGSPFRFESKGVTPLSTFYVKDGYMNVVDENKKWGLLNLKTGSIAIACSYDYVGTYSEGLVSICRYGKWGYADEKGNIVITPTYNYAGEFSGDRAFVITDFNKLAVIDKSGAVTVEYNLSLDDDMNRVNPFSKETGIAVFVNGYNDATTYNLVTSSGEILLQRRDCDGAYVSNNYAFVDGHMYKIQK